MRRQYLSLLYGIALGLGIFLFFYTIVKGEIQISILGFKIVFHRVRYVIWYLIGIVFFALIKKKKLKEGYSKILHVFSKSSALRILMLTYFILFTWIKIVQYFSFNIHAFDFSLFDYVLFNTSRGNFMYDPFDEVMYFKIHFTPILLFFVPFYWIWDTPFLLIMQAIISISGAYAIYKLACYLTKNQVLFSFIYLS